MLLLISFLVFLTTFSFIIWLFSKHEEKMLQRHLNENLPQEKKGLIIFTPLRKKMEKIIEKLEFPLIKKRKLQLEQQLTLAGNPKDVTPANFIVLQILIALLVLLLALLGFKVTNIVYLLILGISGFLLPVLWLKNKIKERKKAIFKNLPDFIDLLVLSMEAGLDFGAAVNKIIEKSEKNPVIEEFYLVHQETKLGKSRVEALKNMLERTRHSVLNMVVGSLIQGIQLGTSLGPLLKVQAEQLRVQRWQLAEKLAAEAPLKMIFPLLFFIFPTIFIILLGPIVLMFIQGKF